MAAADLDRDGDPDVLAASMNDDEVAWYANRLNEASADFAPQRIISTSGDGAFTVRAVDLDLDGDDDVLATSSIDGEITWYENRLGEPSADFAPGQIVSNLSPAPRAFVADLDGDGDPDVVSTSYNGDEVAWYENRLGEPSADFGPRRIVTALADGVNSASLADLDGDGDPDIVSASQNDLKFSWYPNPGTDPTDAETDGDGLADGAEVSLYGTDPSDPDSDRDGVSDGAEVAAGTDPRDPGRYPVVPETCRGRSHRAMPPIRRDSAQSRSRTRSAGSR